MGADLVFTGASLILSYRSELGKQVNFRPAPGMVMGLPPIVLGGAGGKAVPFQVSIALPDIPGPVRAGISPQSGNVMPERMRVWGTGQLPRWLSRSVSRAVAKARQLSAPP